MAPKPNGQCPEKRRGGEEKHREDVHMKAGAEARVVSL